MSKVSVISEEVKALMRDGKIPFYRQQGGSDDIGTIKLGPSMFQNLLDAINSVYGWSSESPSTLHITFDGRLLPSDEFMESQGWIEDGVLTNKGMYNLIKRRYGIEFATHLYGSPAKVMDSEYSKYAVVYESLYVEGGTANLSSENLPEGERWLAQVSRYYLFTERGMQIQHQIPPTVVINPLIADEDSEILYQSLVNPLPIVTHTAEQM
jgi:hypothetical protein